MIAVIADDLTGAAEIGGIGLQYGLKTEINTAVNLNSSADLLVINTDTRSVSEQEAIAITQKVVDELLLLAPSFIYKKIDSVLRGHILAETKVHLAKMGINSALIIPANPYLGRTIINGNYYYKNEPIHLSSFANDPEFAITSSDIKEMLKVNDDELQVLRTNEPLPPTGIVVGEAASAADLDTWALLAKPNILLAGAAGFFTAILKNNLSVTGHPQPSTSINHPALYVCGTTFHKSTSSIKSIKHNHGPVSYMPDSVAGCAVPPAEGYGAWCTEAIGHLKTHNHAVIAIDSDSIIEDSNNAVALREKMAMGVQQIMEQHNIGELLIEGGSTAAAILKQLHISQLFPVEVLAPGVTRMGTDLNSELYITLKPGSYNWPPNLWPF